MKRVFLNPYNLAFVFAFFLSLWSIWSFFSYRIQELPSRFSPSFLSSLEHIYQGNEPVFLSDERLDQLVWNYPRFNIFPGGANSVKKVEAMHNFLLISLEGLPDSFASLSAFSHTMEAQEDGLFLYRFIKKGAPYLEYRASDFLPEFSVSSSLIKGAAQFENNEFRTGPQPWHAVFGRSGVFSDIEIPAVSAHPLDGLDQFLTVTIPPRPELSKAGLWLGFGIADSGNCPECPPVQVRVTQNTLSQVFESRDKVWQVKELRGFSPLSPLSVTLRVEKAGVRHFFFDLYYREKNEK